MKRRLVVLILTVTAIVLGSPYPAAAAQVNSNQATVAVSVTVPESITVTPSTGSLPAFTYTPGAATSDVKTFTVTTAWQLASTHTGSIHMAGWFATANALTSGSNNIPASDFFLAFNSQTLTGNDCGRAADPVVALDTASASSCNNGLIMTVPPPYAGSETDTVKVQLMNLPSNLGVGTYTGTLNIAAGIN